MSLSSNHVESIGGTGPRLSEGRPRTRLRPVDLLDSIPRKQARKVSGRARDDRNHPYGPRRGHAFEIPLPRDPDLPTTGVGRDPYLGRDRGRCEEKDEWRYDPAGETHAGSKVEGSLHRLGVEAKPVSSYDLRRQALRYRVDTPYATNSTRPTPPATPPPDWSSPPALPARPRRRSPPSGTRAPRPERSRANAPSCRVA
jgi:hypothetical protein